MTPVSVVALERSHLRDLMVIDAATYPEPWSKKLWIKELERPDRIYRAALIDDELVAFGGALLAADDAHITTIATTPARQRQSIGTQLLLAIARAAIEVGATGLTLEVRASNHPAQALYRRFGMAPAGVRRGYYQADGEDAIVMWANDINHPDYGARLDAIAASLTQEVAAQ